jgi:MFS superfamily sulfate permease-like transporter
MEALIIVGLALAALLFLRSSNSHSNGVVKYSERVRRAREKELKKQGVTDYHMRKLETEEKIASFVDIISGLLGKGVDDGP